MKILTWNSAEKFVGLGGVNIGGQSTLRLIYSVIHSSSAHHVVRKQWGFNDVISKLLLKQEVKVIWQKAPHGGPIPRLGVTPGVEISTIEFLG